MTPEQIDRVLPRAATWPPKLYDLTDTVERRQACEWLAGLCSEAWERSPKVEQNEPLVVPWASLSNEDPVPLPVEPGNGRTAHRGSNDWDAPKACDCACHFDIWRADEIIDCMCGVRRPDTFEEYRGFVNRHQDKLMGAR